MSPCQGCGYTGLFTLLGFLGPHCWVRCRACGWVGPVADGMWCDECEAWTNHEAGDHEEEA